MITLYSTDCPKCKILKEELNKKGISFEEVNDVDKMIKIGIATVPLLKLENDKILGFYDAYKFIKTI